MKDGDWNASFDECIQDFHVTFEETRRRIAGVSSVSETDIVWCHGALETIHHHVNRLVDTVVPLASSDEDDVRVIMAQSCIQKAASLSRSVWRLVVSDDRRTKKCPDFGRRSQAAIARILELSLLLSDERQQRSDQSDSSSDGDSIGREYASYQKSVLRQRSKPIIAHVADLRRVATTRGVAVSQLIEEQHLLQNGSDDREENEPTAEAQHSQNETTTWTRQPYAHAITVILGEASTLIHPLAQWKTGLLSSSATADRRPNPQNSILSICDETMEVLNNEAQSLAVTMGHWFITDRKVQEWNAAAAQMQDSSIVSQSTKEASNLAYLDATLDEMALLCQVMSRFCRFSSSNSAAPSSPSPPSLSPNNNKNGSATDGLDLYMHLQEQALYYSTMETYLTSQNFNNALRLAAPVEIVLGTSLYVSSVVEDAYYISTRAMERASGTMVDRSIWTVGHWVCELWSVDEGGAVFRALMEQKGCVVGPSTMIDDDEMAKRMLPLGKPKVGGDFASAFLDALDDDLGGGVSKPQRTNGAESRKPVGAPSSGSTLRKADVVRVRLDTQLCTLNGIHSASLACIALSDLFDSLSEDTGENVAKAQRQGSSPSTSMIQFAREVMSSHANSYTRLLHQQIQDVITEWCGVVNVTAPYRPAASKKSSLLCLQRLYGFMIRERYDIDSASFYIAESCDRLERELTLPLKNCRIVSEMTGGKCGGEITMLVAQELSSRVADVVLGTILVLKKPFTDWGSLLLSKQVRALQDLFCGLVIDNDMMGSKKNDHSSRHHDAVGAASSNDTTVGNTAVILKRFNRLSQAVTILQLEKPSDWTLFSYEVAHDDDSLTRDEIQSIMSLRVDFSKESIAAVCGGSTTNVSKRTN